MEHEEILINAVARLMCAIDGESELADQSDAETLARAALADPTHWAVQFFTRALFNKIVTGEQPQNVFRTASGIAGRKKRSIDKCMQISAFVTLQIQSGSTVSKAVELACETFSMAERAIERHLSTVRRADGTLITAHLPDRVLKSVIPSTVIN